MKPFDDDNDNKSPTITSGPGEEEAIKLKNDSNPILSMANARAEKTYGCFKAIGRRDQPSFKDLQREIPNNTNPDYKTSFAFRNDGTKDSFIQLKNKTLIQTNGNKRISTDTEKEYVPRAI